MSEVKLVKALPQVKAEIIIRPSGERVFERLGRATSLYWWYIPEKLRETLLQQAAVTDFSDDVDDHQSGTEQEIEHVAEKYARPA